MTMNKSRLYLILHQWTFVVTFGRSAVVVERELGGAGKMTGVV